MASKRLNWRLIKLHRSYSIEEISRALGVHKNTVRQWQREGMTPLDGNRPALFQGATIRAFLSKRNAGRKCPCPPGTLYCFKCRVPRPAALGMVDYVSINAMSGNVRAICATCETVMHRRARIAALGSIMPDCDVQFVQASSRLNGSPSPSLNCDLERQVTT